MTEQSKNGNTSEEKVGVPAPEGPANLIDTDYVIGQDNIATRKYGVDLDLHGKVFGFSALVIVLFVLITLALPETVEPMFNGIRSWLTDKFSWFFLLSANVFVVLAVVLIFTPLARVRLGGQHATPDFSTMGWFAMLFAAGMGIGLMFYGVSADPLRYRDGRHLDGGRRSHRLGTPRSRGRQPGGGDSVSPRQSTTGVCTRGRFMRWSHWPWPCSRSTRACR